MTDFKLTYKPFGERSILIEWPAKIDLNILNDIISYKEVIIKTLNEELEEVNNAYSSIIVVYKSSIIDYKNKENELKALYIPNNKKSISTSKLWKIPVCYDLAFGIDSKDICSKKNINLKELISLHSNTIYTVYFIGFLPGFPYLGGLDEKLYFPRRASPRMQTKKGAVAIGGNQTGIYPCECPGGWNIIGNSPINLFDDNKETPCYISGGDTLQFYPISIEEHHKINQLVNTNNYQLECEVLND